MARLKGSVSSTEAKVMAREIEQLQGSSYRYNFDFLRLIELIMAYKVTEQVCQFSEDTPIEDRVANVEIPLIGTVTVKPRVFHEKHRLTDEPSLHFDFEFEPTSAFKSDVSMAYAKKNTELAEALSTLYSQRLTELYKRMVEGFE
jgi:hypothetical protein